MDIDFWSYLSRNKIIKIIGLVSALTLLGACGGSGGDSDDGTPGLTELDFADMPATGQTVSPFGEALFEITGLTPGVLYSFSIAGTKSNRLYVSDGLKNLNSPLTEPSTSLTSAWNLKNRNHRLKGVKLS
jgi:hypothetical protein